MWWSSPNHDLINPLAMHAVYAPIRELPATHPYCCTVAVLEWNSGHIIVLPPVAKLEPSIFHYYCSSVFLVYFNFTNISTLTV
jgi:hypothetical protein